jgi:hypothetical protein
MRARSTERLDRPPACKAGSIEQHGLGDMQNGIWGEDDKEAEDKERRYKFLCGDFKNAHRCAVLAAGSRAGQYKYTDIELAGAHLHEMLEELMATQHPKANEHGHAPSH